MTFDTLALEGRASLRSFVDTLMVKLCPLLVVIFQTGRPLMKPSSSCNVNGQMLSLSLVMNEIFKYSGSQSRY